MALVWLLSNCYQKTSPNAANPHKYWVFTAFRFIPTQSSPTGLGLRSYSTRHTPGTSLGDAVGDALEAAPRSSSGTVGGHGVHGVDRADDDRPLEGAHAVAHAGGRASRARRRSTATPCRSGPPRRTPRAGWRRPRAAASRRSRVMAPRQRTPRPGPGKGWRYTMRLGQPQRRADDAHLVLEQQLQRAPPARTAGPPAGRPRCGAPSRRRLRLQDVGVDGALREEAHIVARACGPLPRTRG